MFKKFFKCSYYFLVREYYRRLKKIYRYFEQYEMMDKVNDKLNEFKRFS